MAINVNEVYKTVLLILNKEQRGYITPDEFNKIGTQVQLELFEKYFEDLNQQLRAPLQVAQLDDDYANRVKSIEEKIQIFQTSENLTYVPATKVFALDASKPPIHRIGSIQYEPTGLNATEVQRLTQHEYSLVQRSKLTAPTESWPVYKEQGDLYYVYPNTIQGRIVAYYIKKPTNSRWGFSIGTLGQYLYDPNIYVATGFPLQENYLFSSLTTNYTASGVGVGPVSLDQTNAAVTYTNASGGAGTGTGMVFNLTLDSSGEISNLTVTSPGKDYVIGDKFILSDSLQTVAGGTDALITVGNTTLYSGSTYGSTQFEIDSIDQTELILNILKYCGIVIRDPQILTGATQLAMAEDVNEKS
jgi:hypothetical protein